MSNSSRKRVWILAGLAVGAVAIGAFAISHYLKQSDRPEHENEFPIPPFSHNAFLNTGRDARYVGTEACAVCHRENHRSYLLSAHSRALSDVDPKAEPPDASFDHKASGRSYRVYRENNQLRHEEVVRIQGEVIARTDLPLRYLVGSGHFSRTYIVERDGFLYESPITWYSSKNKWDMSPGYNLAAHAGFERPIVESCMYCHAGRVESVDGAANRLTLHEKAIGCESCHGPGSVHRDFHQSKKVPVGEVDLTIVNPRKLPRAIQEDVCAACHLTGASPTLLRGRTVNDYRPGTPLRDYRIHYRVDDGGDEMMVVGHVEQLRHSACYAKSEMTCLTCHDPHEKEKPKDPVASHRKTCMNCHERHPCTLGEAERIKKDGTDNCTACHMPRGNTDIPHISFTHHRIGHHGRAIAEGRRRPAALVPLESVQHLPPLDQQRHLGLAYMEASRNAAYAEKYGEPFRKEGLRLLKGVYAAGMRDAESMRHLMENEFPSSSSEPNKFAVEILRIKDAPPNTRAAALENLALRDKENAEYSTAIERFEELQKIYNSSYHWFLLGDCYLQQNKAAEALLPFQKSLILKPHNRMIHEALATAYQRLGKDQPARDHLRKSEALTRFEPE